MANKKSWSEMSKVERIIAISIVAIVTFIIMAVAAGGGSKEDTNQKTSSVEPASYTLVEENDISILNCKRTTFKVKVADDASIESVKAMGQKIIDDNKSKWQDITVWSYKNSETDEFVKNNGYTVDMAEYSTCK